jgi:hypothetical protein
MSTKDKTTDEAIQEFLDRGGVIQKVGRNVSGYVEGATSYSAWGRPKKPAAVAPVKEEVVIDEVDEDDIDLEEDIVEVEKEDNEE